MRIMIIALAAFFWTPAAVEAAPSENQIRVAILPFQPLDRVEIDAAQDVAHQVTEGLRRRMSMDPVIEMVSDEELSALAPDTDPASAAIQLNADIVVTGTSIMGSTSRSEEVLRIRYHLYHQAADTDVFTQAFDQDYAEVESMLDGTARAIRIAISQYAPPRAELKPQQSTKTDDTFSAM